jgi:hypothetical protein
MSTPDTTAKPPSVDEFRMQLQRKPRNIAPLIFLGVLAVLGYAGYCLLTYIPADVGREECLRLANDNLTSSYSGRRLYDDVRVMDTWTKNGKRVVELGYFKRPGDTTYSARICVVGGGKVAIVSAFEAGAWR